MSRRSRRDARRPAWSQALRRRAAARGVRRLVAAMLAALTAGASLWLVLARPAPGEIPVLVATRQVPAGTTLEPGDVSVRHLPAQAVPAGALSTTASGVGRVVAAPLAAGEALTDLDLQTSALLEGLPAASVAVFVPLADAVVAAAMTPGDRVDVHSPVDGSVVAEGALVLRSTEGEDAGLWLAVPGSTAVALAAARGADPMGAALQVALQAPGGRE